MTRAKGIRSKHVTDKTFTFHVSEAEKAEIEYEAAVCGMTKQQYCLSRALEREIVVIPISGVQAALTDELSCTLEAVKKMTHAEELDENVKNKINFLRVIVEKLKMGE